MSLNRVVIGFTALLLAVNFGFAAASIKDQLAAAEKAAAPWMDRLTDGQLKILMELHLLSQDPAYDQSISKYAAAYTERRKPVYGKLGSLNETQNNQVLGRLIDPNGARVGNLWMSPLNRDQAKWMIRYAEFLDRSEARSGLSAAYFVTGSETGSSLGLAMARGKEVMALKALQENAQTRKLRLGKMAKRVANVTPEPGLMFPKPIAKSKKCFDELNR